MFYQRSWTDTNAHNAHKTTWNWIIGSNKIEPSRQNSTHHPLIVSYPTDIKGSEFMSRKMHWGVPSLPMTANDPHLLLKQEAPGDYSGPGSRDSCGWFCRNPTLIASVRRSSGRIENHHDGRFDYCDNVVVHAWTPAWWEWRFHFVNNHYQMMERSEQEGSMEIPQTVHHLEGDKASRWMYMDTHHKCGQYYEHCSRLRELKEKLQYVPLPSSIWKD